MRSYMLVILTFVAACGSSPSANTGVDAPSSTGADAPTSSSHDAPTADAASSGGHDGPTGGGVDAPASGGGPDAPVSGGTPDAPVASTADAPVAETPDAPVAATPDAPVAEANAFHYVMSTVKVGANAAEARSFAFDLDGNGMVDDALGLAVISIEPFVSLDIDSTIHDALVNGTIVILDAVHADNLANAAPAD